MIKIVNRFGILHDYCIRILNRESTISFSQITKKSTLLLYYLHRIYIILKTNDILVTYNLMNDIMKTLVVGSN